MFFLTETFFLYLCNFIIAESVNLLELPFDRNLNICKVSSFKDFQNIAFVSKSFFC